MASLPDRETPPLCKWLVVQVSGAIFPRLRCSMRSTRGLQMRISWVWWRSCCSIAFRRLLGSGCETEVEVVTMLGHRKVKHKHSHIWQYFFTDMYIFWYILDSFSAGPKPKQKLGPGWARLTILMWNDGWPGVTRFALSSCRPLFRPGQNPAIYIYLEKETWDMNLEFPDFFDFQEWLSNQVLAWRWENELATGRPLPCLLPRAQYQWIRGATRQQLIQCHPEFLCFFYWRILEAWKMRHDGCSRAVSIFVMRGPD